MSNFDMNMQIEDVMREIDDYEAVMKELNETAAELERANESDKN